MDDYGWLWLIMDDYGWLWMITVIVGNCENIQYLDNNFIFLRMNLLSEHEFSSTITSSSID